MSEQIYAGTEATSQDGAHGVTRPTNPDGGRSATRPTDGERRTLRLPPEDKTPGAKRSFRQIEQSQREHQALIGLSAEVRRQARELGMDREAAEALAQASWGAFRMVNGEPIPVQADRQTVVLGTDGNVMSVTEWVTRQIRGQKTEDGGQPRGADGRWTMEDGEEVLPRRNPFRRKTWNLTEQMQLARRDPRQARKLKAEAWASGE